ncbi:MAG: prolyl oligopeptidase family serine peptidase [Deltaproteobacteria bacterium]|nr:prolyl oligopeptidase family serine peptidase [Deltaproteobacteria bacterium]
MRLAFVCAGSALALAACSSASTPPSPAPSADPPVETPPGETTPSIDPDALPLVGRPYRVRTPQGYDPSKPAPLVLAFHGYGGGESGPKLEKYLRFGAVADSPSGQFLYVTPEGTKDESDERFWNGTDVCCDFDGLRPDDVAYVRALVKDASKKYKVDPKRIYAFGLSGGGYFVHRLACEASDVFAAVVSMSAATYADASRCTPKEGVAIVELHGDADKTVKYEGGHETYGKLDGDYPSARETVRHWATYNGCSPTLTSTSTTYDIVSSIDGAETIVERHEGCAKGAVELWTMKGGIHAPSLASGFATSVWGYFAAHPKP